MPELPEVVTIQSQLKNKILNKKIKEVVIKNKRIIKGISSKKFKSKTEGKTVKGILRRGKVLIIKLENDLFLIIHLRISGWLILSKKEENHARVIFKLADGQMLNFCDRRALGEVKLINDWQKLSIIQTMGPEPLELKKTDFIQLFRGRRAKIKPLLMDQRFLAGIGNIYAQEVVFCAGIHPERGVDKIKKEKLEKIYYCLTAILKQAITKKGSSVDTYRQTNGKKGNFIPFLKVYRKENEACIRCKKPIKRKVIGGRGTYFCPHCQK